MQRVIRSHFGGGRRQRHVDSAGRGVPVGDEGVGVHGAESGGRIVSRSGVVAEGTAQAIGATLGAGHDVVSGHDVVEYGGRALGQPVELGIDVAQPGRGLRLTVDHGLIQQRDDARHGWRGARRSANAGKGA